MVFDDCIYFQDPLVLGHVPLLKALSLTNVACSFHKMVKLSEFPSHTSILDLKLGFKSKRFNIVALLAMASTLLSVLCVYSLQIWVQPECPMEIPASFHQLKGAHQERVSCTTPLDHLQLPNSTLQMTSVPVAENLAVFRAIEYMQYLQK